MRIAQVSPLYESVPPKSYGGTERVVSYLTETLVRMGHRVTLFASGDSVTKAKLVSCSRHSLRLQKDCTDPIVHHVLMMERVYRRAEEFDIIHNHNDYFHYSLARRCAVPTVTTLHGRLDIPELVPLYKEFGEIPVVSISDAQRKPFPSINWQGTVHHGLPADLHVCQEEPGEYLAFIGRISPEKGVDMAIEIARRARMPLKIAAKLNPQEQEYIDKALKPHLGDPFVEYVGEIGEGEKQDFLGNAYALLFPIDWPEPFGLAMIEAMACGTPIIARNRGSVPEIVEDGITGFVVESVEDSVRALRRVGSISRRRVRRAFEERFTDGRMASDYLNIYERLAAAAPARR